MINEEIFIRDKYICPCGKSVYHFGTPQVAHRIADTVMNRKIYGIAVIDHQLNKRAVCSLACNDAQNIGFKPREAEALVDEINRRLKNDC